MHRQIPRSELVVLPDMGHLSFIEAPEAFDDVVRRWLRTHEEA
jgi:pimeloyl-ACP methyl ester carboxylesterase